MNLIFADSSALAKLFLDESESRTLERFLDQGPPVAAAAIARVEVLRALRRASASPEAIEQAIDYFEKIHLRRSTDELLDRAARLAPWTLRAIDAIHLATALDFSPPPDLFLCYDQRLADAARAHGLAVVAPGVDEVHEQ